MSRSTRSTAPSKKQRDPLGPRLAMIVGLALVPIILIVAGYTLYVYFGVLSGASTPTGTLAGLGVQEPASIVRDERGIPHIRARNRHDMFFLEGYAQGTDRLFQLDLYRRIVAGRLAEIFGKGALDSDFAARTYDIDAIANAELARLTPAQRADVDAFADGVNAAMRTRPLPPEFRALFYTPEPWSAKDTLVASFSTVLALTDSWYDVAVRADVVDLLGPKAVDAFFPISDPAYDAPTTSRVAAPVAPLPPIGVPYPRASPLYLASLDSRAGRGSNNFVAGAALTATHRALLANDPHLDLEIPGIWWAVDLACPGFHAAGVTLAGVPGVVLGHNEHVAWGATNGTVATVSIYRERFQSALSDEYLAGNAWAQAAHRTETFKVRFAQAVLHDYLRTRHGFVFDDRGVIKLAARWTADVDRRSPIATFLGLDAAASVGDAIGALAVYPGPPQNFVFADDRGNAGYWLAGEIPLDPAWGITAHDGVSSPASGISNVSFAQLPHLAASRNVFAFTANARPYGRGYPYRLSPSFTPPYRAHEVERDLARGPYDIARFSAVQADVMSPAERELAVAAVRAVERKHLVHDHAIAEAYGALRGFDGRFTGDSKDAVFATELRRACMELIVRIHMPRELAFRYLAVADEQAFEVVLRMLRERPRGWVPDDDYDEFLVVALRDSVVSLHRRGQYGETWADGGARTAQHPLVTLSPVFSVWNGTRFPGFGGVYPPHVQANANTQSFRAVWDVGNWGAGGLVIPLGESGEPGSPHYRDLANTWLHGNLVPLPFDDADVARHAVETLQLTP